MIVDLFSVAGRFNEITQEDYDKIDQDCIKIVAILGYVTTVLFSR